MFTNKPRVTICVSLLHISTISRQLKQTTERSLDIHSSEPSACCPVSQPVRACVRKTEYEDMKGGVNQRAGNHRLGVRRRNSHSKNKGKEGAHPYPLYIHLHAYTRPRRSDYLLFSLCSTPSHVQRSPSLLSSSSPGFQHFL